MVSILISSILGSLSLISGLLSLWFAYAFSSRRYKNRYLKELIKLAKLETSQRPKYSFEDFFNDYGNLYFAEQRETSNSYVLPKINISCELLKLSNFNLQFKFSFKFNKDYFISWERTDIVPLRKVGSKILFGPKKIIIILFDHIQKLILWIIH